MVANRYNVDGNMLQKYKMICMRNQSNQFKRVQFNS